MYYHHSHVNTIGLINRWLAGVKVRGEYLRGRYG